MGVAGFPLPEEMSETIKLLNASRTWNLTLVQRDDKIWLVGGDQLDFTANSVGEAEAFLAGCFLATYMGNSLSTIREELASGKFHEARDVADILDEVKKQRRELYSEGV